MFEILCYTPKQFTLITLRLSLLDIKYDVRPHSKFSKETPKVIVVDYDEFIQIFN